jgi:hypothetical protein
MADSSAGCYLYLFTPPYYQEASAVYGIEPVKLISGALPKRQQRMIEAWAELHQAELLADWHRLQAGQPSLPIAPLS